MIFDAVHGDGKISKRDPIQSSNIDSTFSHYQTES